MATGPGPGQTGGQVPGHAVRVATDPVQPHERQARMYVGNSVAMAGVPLWVQNPQGAR